MRNLWRIMSEFGTLPTNEDFRKLTDDQIDLILYSMEQDIREKELARKGLTVESEYYDSSFEEEIWNKDVGDWEVLKDGHDPNEIARQVEKMTKEEERKNLMSKFEGLDEYNAHLEAGGQSSREMEVSDYIDQQIKRVQEEAKMREQGYKKGNGVLDDRDLPGVQDTSPGLSKLNKEAINKTIALFNEEDDDDDYTPL